MKQHLRPCPFCGGEAGFSRKVEWNMDGNNKVKTVSERHRIACRSCSCGTDWLCYEEDAVDLWNARSK